MVDAGDETISVAGAPPPIDRELGRGKSIGRYELVAELGTGGMGVVWEADDRELDRRVALKVVRTVVSETAQQRLRREAQAMAKLSHPAVVPVFDTFVAGDRVVVVMELVAGKTLRAVIRDDKPPWQQVLALFDAAGRGLAAAHAVGIVHCDFKPDNVLVGDGVVKVTDFGLARLATESTPVSGGTPRYMAPEQRDGSVTASSDQYSFCVALFEALAGALPDDDLRGLPPQLPRRAREAIARGLSTDPARRFPTIGELLDALRPRRRAWWIAGSAAVVGIAIAATWLVVRPASAEVCELENPLAALPVVKIRAALGTSAAGTEAATRVIDNLTRYASAWGAQRIASCRATTAGEQSADLLDRRTSCLDERARTVSAFAAQVAQLEHPTPVQLTKIVTASLELPSLAVCEDRAALLASVPPPDPATRQRVAALDDRMAPLRATLDIGTGAAQIPELERLVADATSIGHAPQIARARMLLARAFDTSSKPEQAAAAYQEAARDAARGKDDETGANVWLGYLRMMRRVRKLDQLEALVPAARAMVARAGDRPELVVELERSLASIETTTGKFQSAEDRMRKVLASDAARDPKLRVALLLTFAEVLKANGKSDEALKVAREHIDHVERLFGVHSTSFVTALYTLARMESVTNHCADAARTIARELQVSTEVYGAGSPELIFDYMEQGKIATCNKDDATMRAAFDRALQIAEANKAAAKLAMVRGIYGFALIMRDHNAEAIPLLEGVIASLPPNDHLQLGNYSYALGEAFRQTGKLDAAIAAFQRADVEYGHTEVKHDRGMALLGLARAQVASNKPREAIAALERARQLTAGSSSPDVKNIADELAKLRASHH